YSSRRLIHNVVAKQRRHRIDGPVRIADHEADAVQAADREVGFEAVGDPRSARVAIGRNQLERQPRSIREADRRLAEVRLDVGDGHAVRGEARAPFGERSGRNRKRCYRHLTRALGSHADAPALVRKRRPDGAGRAALVAVVEVVGVVVVEVDRLLDEPQSQSTYAEIEVVLCVVDGRGDVMQAQDRHRGRPDRGSYNRALLEAARSTVLEPARSAGLQACRYEQPWNLSETVRILPPGF